MLVYFVARRQVDQAVAAQRGPFRRERGVVVVVIIALAHELVFAAHRPGVDAVIDAALVDLPGAARQLPVIGVVVRILEVGAEPQRGIAEIFFRCQGQPAQRGLTNVVSRSEEHTSELQSLMRISYADLRYKEK